MAITWEQLQRARKRAGLTQRQLAEEVGVSQRTIVNWEAEDGQGVPSKAEASVRRRLGATLDYQTVRDEEERRYRGSMSRKQRRLMEEVETEVGAYSLVGDEELYERAMAERGIDGVDRKRRILALFTDADMLTELSRRARERGVDVSSWSTSALERDVQRQIALEPVIRDLHYFTPSPAADPDYSNLSQADHGLAAYEGDKDIPFDADPED